MSVRRPLLLLLYPLIFWTPVPQIFRIDKTCSDSNPLRHRFHDLSGRTSRHICTLEEVPTLYCMRPPDCSLLPAQWTLHFADTFPAGPASYSDSDPRQLSKMKSSFATAPKSLNEACPSPPSFHWHRD